MFHIGDKAFQKTTATTKTFHHHVHRQYSATNRRWECPPAVSERRSPPSRVDLHESKQTKACFTVTQHLEHTGSSMAEAAYHCQAAFVSSRQSPLEPSWGAVPFHAFVCLGPCTSKVLCLHREQITSVSPLFSPGNTSADASLVFKIHCHLVALGGAGGWDNNIVHPQRCHHSSEWQKDADRWTVKRCRVSGLGVFKSSPCEWRIHEMGIHRILSESVWWASFSF